MLVPLILLVAGQGTGAESPELGVLAFVLGTGVLPTLFVYLAYTRGQISSLDLERRSDRVVPSTFAAICAVGVLPILHYLGASDDLLRVDAGLALQFAILAAVSTWWKISFHAASAAGVGLVAVLLEGPVLAIPAVGLVVLVCWARVCMRRHTWQEGVGGVLAAAGCVAVAWM
jgi:membrane-associated phospholipid phosphatase